MPTVPQDSQTHAKRILNSHTKIGIEKPISYLPVNTIIDVISMDIESYRSIIASDDVKTLLFSQEECCIKSGAVYAYHNIGLSSILKENEALLIENGWPTDSITFVKRIASEWLDDASPVIPVIRKSFGDS